MRWPKSISIGIGNYYFLMPRIVRGPGHYALGLNNETEDVMFVPFLDYDDVYYSVVERDCKKLMNAMGLCTLVVLCSREEEMMNQWGEKEMVGNYLVFGIDKLTYIQHIMMGKISRCDWLHRKGGEYMPSRNWVLRISGKYGIEDGKPVDFRPEPTVKQVFHRKGLCRYEHSNGFIGFFKNHFDISLMVSNIDRFKRIEYVLYKTRGKKR